MIALRKPGSVANSTCLTGGVHPTNLCQFVDRIYDTHGYALIATGKEPQTLINL